MRKSPRFEGNPVATYANSKAIVDEQAARAAITEVTDT